MANHAGGVARGAEVTGEVLRRGGSGGLMGGGGADVKGGGGSGGSRAFTLPNSAFSASWSPHDRRALQGGAYDACTL